MVDSTKLKIVFMGTSQFSADILQSLLKNNYNIISVYTRPDKKVGRDQETQKSVVKVEAEKNNLKIFQPEKFNEDVVVELKNQKPDLIVVAAYGKILPEAVLKIPKRGALNVHTSLLPKFRGPSPVQNAILEGEKETGVTLMLMDKGMDTGDIIDQIKIPIDPDETNQDLMKKMSGISAEFLLKTLPLWVEGKISPQKQDESKASYCQLIERADGKILWNQPALSIYNRFRAFSPWPGIFTFWEKEGKTLRLKLNKIGLDEKKQERKHPIGEIFKEEEEIAVETSEGMIILKEIQLEGKSNVSADDFANGYSSFLGSVLK